MRILTYKRTHVGDPDNLGRFGINDCMGQVREFRFEAVIGVGGVGREPRSARIDRKINWVGLGPKRIPDIQGIRAEIVQFDHFILLEDAGPLVESLAPNLARRIYGRCRYILKSYSDVEKADAMAIIEWARSQRPTTTILSEMENSAPCGPAALSACKRSVPLVHSTSFNQQE